MRMFQFNITRNCIRRSNGNVCAAKISCNMDKWRSDYRNCVRIACPVAEDHFYVNADYFEGLGYDFPDTLWDVFSREESEQKFILNEIDNKYKHWLNCGVTFITECQNLDSQFPFEIALLIWSFGDPHPGNVKFDLNEWKNDYGINDRAQTSCMKCAIYVDNPIYDVVDMTNAQIKLHKTSEKHKKACGYVNDQ